MKRLTFLLLASLLVLSACGGNEEKTHKDDNKKSEIKNDKKKDKEKTSNKNTTKSSEKKNTNEQSKQNQQNYTQDSQQIQQQPEQTQQAIEQNNQQQNNVATFQEQMEANAKVAKQHGYTGIPNGDVGGVPTSDKAYSNDQLDPETGLPKDDAVPKNTE
ncbi:hypothetical protein O0D86_00080 [Staphylococcus pseudintermedius]|uniref:hypothetical protein n=1 Tax=Staphylococcus coagulans TaxID=74706 RepID=UPI000FEC8A08|nr:hypothetical protein [Staphylococcus pseudintermedius]MDK3888790.1 hypothetical protein [Staphylococcus pseudintermedius]